VAKHTRAARHITAGHGEPWANPKISPEENPINAPNIISFFIFNEL
jgi:hypothetical protein